MFSQTSDASVPPVDKILNIDGTITYMLGKVIEDPRYKDRAIQELIYHLKAHLKKEKKQYGNAKFHPSYEKLHIERHPFKISLPRESEFSIVIEERRYPGNPRLHVIALARGSFNEQVTRAAIVAAYL